MTSELFFAHMSRASCLYGIDRAERNDQGQVGKPVRAGGMKEKCGSLLDRAWPDLGFCRDQICDTEPAMIFCWTSPLGGEGAAAEGRMFNATRRSRSRRYESREAYGSLPHRQVCFSAGDKLAPRRRMQNCVAR